MPSGRPRPRQTEQTPTALRKERELAVDLLLPLIILVPLGLLIYQQRKRQRAFAEQQSRLAVGQTVMTTAGLYGEVVEVLDDQMVLEVAPGVRLRWNKAAVGKIVSGDPVHDDLGLEPPSDTATSPDTAAADDAPGDRRDGGPDLSKS